MRVPTSLLTIVLSFVVYSFFAQTGMEKDTSSKSIRLLPVPTSLLYTRFVPAPQPWPGMRTGVILALGTEIEMLVTIGDDHQRILADGNLVLPKFVDTHVHVPEAGINEELYFLALEENIEVYEEVVADCAPVHEGIDRVRAARVQRCPSACTEQLTPTWYIRMMNPDLA